MTFGLITEGVTDQLVINTIIDTIVNSDDEKADVVQLCPVPKETGTWSKVFNYIQSDTFHQFFLIRDDNHAIIQIDTDMINDWFAFFKENHSIQAHLKTFPSLAKESVADILEKVTQLFRLLIGIEFYDRYQDRIICAISVDDMECWVLAMHAERKSDRTKVRGCIGALNQILDGYSIDANDKAAENSKYYRKAIKGMTKKDSLLSKCHHNESLKFFVDRISVYA